MPKPTPVLQPEGAPDTARFGRYNFQREEDVARLTTALGATDGPAIVLLSGEPGIGRRYILAAAVHRLCEAGAAPEEILPIDLEGYDEEGDLGRYLDLQMKKRQTEQEEHQKERRDALVSLMSLGLAKGTGLATLLSAALSLKEPAAALKKLFGDTGKGYSGKRFSDREVYAAFFGGFTGKVIVHVVAPALYHAVPSPENPRRWLPEVAERFPHLVLVVSCGPEDQVEDLVPGARHEVERLELRRLDRLDLRARLNLRFAPNAFPPDLAYTLLRYSEGHPGTLGSTLWRLEFKGALTEDEHGVWKVDDAKVASLLSEDLFDPLSRAFHEHPEGTRALETFLLDAALCGDLVPANVLVNLQGLAEEVEEELIDRIDEELVDRLGVFEDLEYTHPGFSSSVNVYRFREPLVRLAVLEQFLRDRNKRAAEIAPALRQGLPVRTRDVARLFVTLAEHLGEVERVEYLRDLAWWVGSTEAEELRDQLAAEVAEGRLKPETLWNALQGTKDRWPAYRRLALLDAYGIGPRDEEGNPLGVPWERLGDFHMLRARLLDDLGQYHEAMEHAKQAVRICETQSGKRSLPYLGAAALAGFLAERFGDFAGAKKALVQVLELEGQLLGPEHPLTFATKNNLAIVLKALGDLVWARELLEEVLEGEACLRSLEHPETLKTKSNLAIVLRDLGELEQARELLEEILETDVCLRGPQHPDTLKTKVNLAQVLDDLGDFERARKVLEEALEAGARLHGPEHPQTLTTKHSLALVLWNLGELEQARELFEEALEANARLRGLEHPDTCAAKTGLANVLIDIGNLDRARELFDEVLETETHLLGLEHPNTLATQYGLATALRNLGMLTQARELYEKILAATTRLRGPEHPSTLAVKCGLAGALKKLGNPTQARELYEEVLRAYARLLGPEHPHTLVTKHRLAGVLKDLGDLDQAREAYGEALEIRSRVLGPEHPKTKETREELLKLG